MYKWATGKVNCAYQQTEITYHVGLGFVYPEVQGFTFYVAHVHVVATLDGFVILRCNNRRLTTAKVGGVFAYQLNSQGKLYLEGKINLRMRSFEIKRIYHFY